MGDLFSRRSLLLSGAAALASTVPVRFAQAASAQRIITVGGAVTEIAFALGQQSRIIARDSTSSYPEAARSLPDVGYMRALSPEGVLSMNPDLIIAIDGAGPPQTLDVLREAQVPFVEIAEGYSAQAIEAKIRAVSAALDAETSGDSLAEDVRANVDAAVSKGHALAGENPRRVLFVLSAQGGRIMAGGADTAADAIISMSGALNAAGGFAGFKPMTDEAIVAAAPDVILLMNHGGPMSLSNDDLFGLPALGATPAAERQSVIRMDGLHLLGFGPRTASAIAALSEALYGDRQS